VAPLAAGSGSLNGRGTGGILAGGIEHDVSFELREDINSDVDDACRGKYGRSSYVDAMVVPAEVAPTLRAVPR
jgi:hypothetical protein